MMIDSIRMNRFDYKYLSGPKWQESTSGRCLRKRLDTQMISTTMVLTMSGAKEDHLQPFILYATMSRSP